MKHLITGILITVLILIGISGYALYANQVPWHDPPGFWARLGVYMSQNSVKTSPDAHFPELRPRTYGIPAKALFDQLPGIITGLGWEIQNVDADTMIIEAVVKTRWLRFSDDISFRVSPLSNNKSSIEIQSASRLGRADYGANLGHILRFYSDFERQSGK